MQRRYRKPKPQKESIKKFRFNEKIKSPKVFLIDQEDNKIGIMDTTEAILKAQTINMDLVEVAPKAIPPVAKIMDYGQYKYEIEKKIRKAKAHQKIAELKAIRLSFRIKGKDLETKANQAIKFLEDGHQVKIDIILKGREKAHKSIAIENMQKFIDALNIKLKILQPIAAQGGQISTTVTKT